MGSKVLLGNSKRLGSQKSKSETEAYCDEDDTITLLDMIRISGRAKQQRPAKHLVEAMGLTEEPEPGKRNAAAAAGDVSSASDGEGGVKMKHYKRKRKSKDLSDIMKGEPPISCLIRNRQDGSSGQPSWGGFKKSEPSFNVADGRRKFRPASLQLAPIKRPEGVHEYLQPLATGSSPLCKTADDTGDMMDTLKSFSDSLKHHRQSFPVVVQEVERMEDQAENCSITELQLSDTISVPDHLPLSGSGLHTCKDPKNCQNACVAKAVAPNLDHMSDEELIYWYEEVTGKKFLSRSGEKVRGRIRRVIRAEVKTAAAAAAAINSNSSASLLPGRCDSSSESLVFLQPRTPSPVNLVIDLHPLDSSPATEGIARTGAEEEVFCAFNSASSFDDHVEEEIGSIPIKESDLGSGFISTQDGEQLEHKPTKDQTLAVESVEEMSFPSAVPDVGPEIEASAELINGCGDSSSSYRKQAAGEHLGGQFVHVAHTEGEEVVLPADSAGRGTMSLGNVAGHILTEETDSRVLQTATDDGIADCDATADSMQESLVSELHFAVAEQSHAPVDIQKNTTPTIWEDCQGGEPARLQIPDKDGSLKPEPESFPTSLESPVIELNFAAAVQSHAAVDVESNTTPIIREDCQGGEPARLQIPDEDGSLKPEPENFPASLELPVIELNFAAAEQSHAPVDVESNTTPIIREDCRGGEPARLLTSGEDGSLKAEPGNSSSFLNSPAGELNIAVVERSHATLGNQKNTMPTSWEDCQAGEDVVLLNSDEDGPRKTEPENFPPSRESPRIELNFAVVEQSQAPVGSQKNTTPIILEDRQAGEDVVLLTSDEDGSLKMEPGSFPNFLTSPSNEELNFADAEESHATLENHQNTLPITREYCQAGEAVVLLNSDEDGSLKLVPENFQNFLKLPADELKFADADESDATLGNQQNTMSITREDCQGREPAVLLTPDEDGSLKIEPRNFPSFLNSADSDLNFAVAEDSDSPLGSQKNTMAINLDCQAGEAAVLLTSDEDGSLKTERESLPSFLKSEDSELNFAVAERFQATPGNLEITMGITQEDCQAGEAAVVLTSDEDGQLETEPEILPSFLKSPAGKDASCTADFKDSSRACEVANAELQRAVRSELVWAVGRSRDLDNPTSSDPRDTLDAAEAEEREPNSFSNVPSIEVTDPLACPDRKHDPRREEEEESVPQNTERLECRTVNNDSSVDCTSESPQQSATVFPDFQEWNEETPEDIPVALATCHQVEIHSTCLNQTELVTIAEAGHVQNALQNGSEPSQVCLNQLYGDGALPEGGWAMLVEDGSQQPGSSTPEVTEGSHKVSPDQIGDDMDWSVESCHVTEDLKRSDGAGLSALHPTAMSLETLGGEFEACGEDDTEDRVLSLEEYIAGHQAEEPPASPQALEEDVSVQDLEEEDVVALQKVVVVEAVASQQVRREAGVEQELGDDFAAQQMLEDVACPQQQQQPEREVDLGEKTRTLDIEKQGEEVLGPLETEDLEAQEMEDEVALEECSSPQTMLTSLQKQETEEYGAENEVDADVPEEIENVAAHEEDNDVSHPMEEIDSTRDSREDGTALELGEREEYGAESKLEADVPEEIENVVAQEENDDVSHPVEEEKDASRPFQDGGTALELGENISLQDLEQDAPFQPKVECVESPQMQGGVTVQRARDFGAANEEEDALVQDLDEDIAGQEIEEELASQKMNVGSTEEGLEEGFVAKEIVGHVESEQTQGEVPLQDSEECSAEKPVEGYLPLSEIQEDVSLQDLGEDLSAQQLEVGGSAQRAQEHITCHELDEYSAAQQSEADATPQSTQGRAALLHRSEFDDPENEAEQSLGPLQITEVAVPPLEEDVAAGQMEVDVARDVAPESVAMFISESSLITPCPTRHLLEDGSLQRLEDSAAARELEEGAAVQPVEELVALQQAAGAAEEEFAGQQAMQNSQPAVVGPGQMQIASTSHNSESSSFENLVMAPFPPLSLLPSTVLLDPRDGNVSPYFPASHKNGLAEDSNLCERGLEDEYPVMLTQPQRLESPEDCHLDVTNGVQGTSPAASSLYPVMTRASPKLEKSIQAVEQNFVSAAEMPSSQAEGAELVAPASDLLAGEIGKTEAFATKQQSPLSTGCPSCMTDSEFDNSDNFKHATLGVEWQDAGKFLEQEDATVHSPEKRKFCDSQNDDRAKRLAVEGAFQENIPFTRIQDPSSETAPEVCPMDDEHVPTALSKAVIERNGDRRGAVDSVTNVSDQMSSSVWQQRSAKERRDKLVIREQRRVSLRRSLQAMDFFKPSSSSLDLAGSSDPLLDGQQQAHADCHAPTPNSTCDLAQSREPDDSIDLLACEQLGQEVGSEDFEPPSKLPRSRKTISPLSQRELMRASSSNSPSSSESPPQKIPPFRLKLPLGCTRDDGGLDQLNHRSSNGCSHLDPNDVTEDSIGNIVPLDSSDEDTECSWGRQQEHGQNSIGEEPVRTFSLALSPLSPSPQSKNADSSQRISSQEARDSQSNGAPSPKGILKSGAQPCKGPCKCPQCTTSRSKAGTALDFIASQMKTFQQIAGQLTKETQGLRALMEAKLSGPGETDEIKETLKKSRDVEVAADKNLASLVRDCKRYCKLMAKKPSPSRKIMFADEAGKKLCHVKTFHSQSLPRSLLDLYKL